MKVKKSAHYATADEVLAGRDLSGKIVVVTGGVSGIGVETARAFASRGAEVVISYRRVDQAKKIVESIKETTGNQSISAIRLELGSLKSIYEFANTFFERYDKLHILVNNAGIMACPFEKTQHGFERQFGINHLGHFLLTNLLTPALLNGAPSRVVVVSSRGHQASAVNFEDIHYQRRPYNSWTAYGQSKTANILHAMELDRRLESNGVRACAVHPGVVRTELCRYMNSDDWAKVISHAACEGRLKSLSEGAATVVYGATTRELEVGGKYLSNCSVAQMSDHQNYDVVRYYAVDSELSSRLWEVSSWEWSRQNCKKIS